MAGGRERDGGEGSGEAIDAVAALRRAGRLADALERMPEALDRGDLVARALAYLGQLRAAAKALRAARLAAGRALRHAAEAAEAPLRDAEARLAAVAATVAARLAAAERFHDPAEDAGRGGRAAADPLIERADARPAASGAETAAAAETGAGAAETGAGAGAGANSAPEVLIPVVACVEAVERAALDLEALRGSFTDAELKRAAERHLRETGLRLRGVRYGRRVTGRD